MSPASSLIAEEVTDQDIRVFKTTLLSRRFPGLQSLPDKDIRDLILADRKAAGRRLAAPTKTHPKTQFSPLPCKREQWPGSQQPAFIYVNPAQAKEDVRRPILQSFISTGTLYDAEHTDHMEFRNDDESKRAAAFKPSSFSQAKDSIKVDYFLNSADSETKQAELAATRQRGAELKGIYMLQTTARRGRTLV